MSKVTAIPLHKLSASPRNVRKTGIEDVSDILASIEAHGLLQNLQVVAVKKGRYEVVAGGRRLKAMQMLVEAGKLDADTLVHCQIVDAANATEISLAENAIRASMHPSDQFIAFQELSQQGRSVADIAARFGTSENTVNQRLKLATVSPALMEVYRQNGMTLEQLMAFTVSNDHDKQEAVWHEVANSWQKEPRTIRRMLTETRIPGNDDRARCIGEEAYIAAGGSITRDLFSEEIYFDDPELLNQLLAEKTVEFAATLKADGWLWADADFTNTRDLSQYGRMESFDVPMTDEEAEEYRMLEDGMAEIEALHEAGDATPEQEDEYDVLERRKNSLERRPQQYRSEDKARSGVVIRLDSKGGYRLTYGLVRAEDRTVAEVGAGKAKKAKPRISAPLLEDLTAHRTAAMRALMLEKPEEAHTALLHTLVCEYFLHSGERALTMRLHTADIKRNSPTIADSMAGIIIAQEESYWQERVPSQAREVWAWLDGLDAAEKSRLQTFCTAMLVDSTTYAKGQQNNVYSNPMPLVTRMNLDMAQWWQPTVATYFSRVAMPLIVEAVQETRGAVEATYTAKQKKSVAALNAEKLLHGKRWLPIELRHGNSLPDFTQDDETDSHAEFEAEEDYESA